MNRLLFIVFLICQYTAFASEGDGQSPVDNSQSNTGGNNNEPVKVDGGKDVSGGDGQCPVDNSQSNTGGNNNEPVKVDGGKDVSGGEGDSPGEVSAPQNTVETNQESDEEAKKKAKEQEEAERLAKEEEEKRKAKEQEEAAKKAKEEEEKRKKLEEEVRKGLEEDEADNRECLKQMEEERNKKREEKKLRAEKERVKKLEEEKKAKELEERAKKVRAVMHNRVSKVDKPNHEELLAKVVELLEELENRNAESNRYETVDLLEGYDLLLFDVNSDGDDEAFDVEELQVSVTTVRLFTPKDGCVLDSVYDSQRNEMLWRRYRNPKYSVVALVYTDRLVSFVLFVMDINHNKSEVIHFNKNNNYGWVEYSRGPMSE